MGLKDKFDDMKCAVNTKWENFKGGCRMVYRDFKTWGDEHPREALMLGAAIVTGACSFGSQALRTANSTANRIHEEHLEQKALCDVYDRRTSTHYYTKRPLTNSEKMYVEEQYQQGRNKSDVLEELKLLAR